MKKIGSITGLLLLSAILSVQAADNMKAFPPADEGMVRYVLKLQKQDDESIFKVELIVGKTVQVDEENIYFFKGKIETETIHGWGFPRYIVGEAGTLKAIDANAPKIERFITISGEPYFIRYNSRLPIVVYVPDGVEVRYRVWSVHFGTKVIEKS